MAEGRVVDTGTLSDLLSRQPGFRALWEDYTASAPAPMADTVMADP
jgi:hypothetical protein